MPRRFLVPVLDGCRTKLSTVDFALYVAEPGDEVYLLFVLLDTSNQERAQLETSLRALYGPVLDSKQGVSCTLHAVCVRSWRELGRSEEEVVARAICTKAQQLMATVVTEQPGQPTACLAPILPLRKRRSPLELMLQSGHWPVVSAPAQTRRPTALLRSAQKWVVHL